MAVPGGTCLGQWQALPMSTFVLWRQSQAAPLTEHERTPPRRTAFVLFPPALRPLAMASTAMDVVDSAAVEKKLGQSLDDLIKQQASKSGVRMLTSTGRGSSQAEADCHAWASLPAVVHGSARIRACL